MTSAATAPRALVATLPLVPVALAFAGGIALAPWTDASAAWAVWLVAAGGGLAGLALDPSDRVTRRGWLLLLAGVAALGALRGSPPPLPAGHLARLSLPRPARVEGRLAAEPISVEGDRTRLLVEAERADGLARSGRLHVTVYGGAPALAAGQQVAVECRLHRAAGFRNPGGYDWTAHLAREGVHVVCAAGAGRVVALDDARPPWPARVRRRALETLGRGLPPASAALLGGLLLGDRSGLTRETHEAFRRAGVYHVLAVSGFNVALVAATVFALLRLARAGRRTAAVAAIAVVIAFALVVGPEPSVLRAVIMAVLVLAALLLEREAAVANSLALAALVILAARPGDLFDPGFQLSFAATAGIVAAPLPRSMVGGAVGVSLAAQLAVLPITLAHFNQLSTVGVVANLGVVPLAAAATVVGLAAVALAVLSDALAAMLLDAVWPALILLRALVGLAASLPGAVVHLPAPHGTAVVAYAAALGLGLRAWRLRVDRPRAARRAAGAALLLALAAAAVTAWPLLRPPDGRLRVTVLDVGQGDAIVVEAPDGRALLIDAGGGGPMRLDAGERVVAPFLWNRGILRLAGAVATHADADHAGGMGSIRRLFAIEETWDAENLAGSPRPLGGVMISSLRVSPVPSRGSRNDEALVLRVEYGLASFLLASDIGAATEAALVARGAPLAAAVLKVAHHGARTSSTAAFLRAVRPTAAVISVGARNPYGHPDAGTLERLAAAGARTYRTDQDGAVSVETDGRALTVTRWAGRQVERFCLDGETIC